MKPIRQNEFFRQKVIELNSSLRQVECIVNNHNLYEGIIIENILRSFLRSIMPKRIGITQGFVEKQGSLSPQCDIIMYNQIDYAPIYSYGEISILPAESVIAVIEVKKTINESGFVKVLESFDRLTEMGVLKKYLFLFQGRRIKTIENYFYAKDCVHIKQRVPEFIYDHDNFGSLPQSIISIVPDYYLQQDYVVRKKDMMGYNAYGIKDKTNKNITCLQTFVSELMNLIVPEKDMDISQLNILSNTGETEDSLNTMELIGEIGLFQM